MSDSSTAKSNFVSLSTVQLMVVCISLRCTLVKHFFFSSRRRHTRLTCDWSSDVCSSDLGFDRPSRVSMPTHPQLGEVECGGMDTREGLSNPPREMVADICDKHAKMFLRVAAMAPERSEERRVGKEGRERGSAGPGKHRRG